MEEELPPQLLTKKDTNPAVLNEKYIKPGLGTGRSWKEYLVESVLIVFSVVLALILTEVFNKRHEKQHSRDIINAVRVELIHNSRAAEEQYKYHLQVLKNIDSALAKPALQQQFINKGMLNFNIIASQGVLYRDLNDVAWQVAKQDNIFTKLPLDDYTLLTDIYDNQARITKSEEEIANVLLSRESRTVRDNRITLLLLHDNYHGWAVDRVPALLIKYEKAIEALDKYAK